MKTNITRSATLLLGAAGVALLAGCGGGGGNGNSGGGTNTGTNTNAGTNTNTGNNNGNNNTSQVIGKVTDVNGKGIPGVGITVDTGGQLATTISTGGYRLANLSGNVAHKISAFATVGGVQYSGSTQVFTSPSNLVSNANILLSQVSQQATVQGQVFDSSGNPISGASVYLSVPNLPIAGTTGNYSSLVAFTDSTGFYQIANVPSALQTGIVLMTASDATSTTAYQNQNATLAQNAVTAGAVVTQNFTLTGSTGAAADVPVLVGANAFTQPTDGLTGSALKARLTTAAGSSGSVYEGLRRLLSPTYAGYAARKRSLGKRLQSRAVTGSYAVETDLGFNPPAATDTSLLEYYIYRNTGVSTASPLTESNANFYDSLVDPLANYYTDLTASTDPGSTPYAGGTTYNFALSSVAAAVSGGSTRSNESALSNTISITPLSPLTLNTPVASTVVTSPVTVSWTPVAGATKYYVFVYSQFPSIDTVPMNSTQIPLPAGTSSTTVTLTGGTTTYYVVVVATADEIEEAGSTVPVVNAAQSYSEITQFVVQ